MRTVIIVSKCLGIIKSKRSKNQFYFHFKGVYAGSYVSKIILRFPEDKVPIKSEEYVIVAQFLNYKDEVLEGEVIKFKLLSECSSLS